MSKEKTEDKITIKEKAATSVKTVAVITKNLEQFALATALLITTVFAYTNIKDITNRVWYFTVLGSLVIVGLFAFWRLVVFFKKEG